MDQRWLAACGGAIYTMDPGRPRAAALLACNGRLVHLGADEEVRALAAHASHLGQVREIDLAGHCVLPAFTDSHIHFLSMGTSLDGVALAGVTSLEEVLRRVGVAAESAEPGEWVQGWGWDHSLWPDPRFPDKRSLDLVSPGVPVALRRKDGHLTWVNSAALAAAGITRGTVDPPGGRIGRDAEGQPNGLFFETAADLIHRSIPDLSEAQRLRAARRAQDELLRMGVVGVHIPEGPATLRTLQRMEATGDLHLRVCMMLTYDGLDEAIETGLRSGFGSDRLRLGPVKVFSDGSLGSETAAMLDPFEGSEDNRGVLTLPEEAIRDAIARAARAGLACAIHAIGDRANRVVLDAFEATRDLWRPAGLRQRIEHAQVLHPQDLPRFASLGVIASVQPIHATQDMDLVDRLWGERGQGAYAFKSLLESGAALAFGSDAPVETADPLAGLYAAVTRRRLDGRPEAGWYPAQRLTVEEAIRAYTMGAAYAAGQEHLAGSLTPGKFADFVVLSRDVLRGPPEVITQARVLQTIFDGEVVFAA
jgi:hypothetical protein